MINMFIAGFTAGAVIDSINKNNSLWWTLWLIIVMILNLFCALWNNNKNGEIKRNTNRFGYCKSPTFPRPPRPGQGYQPKLRYHDNSGLEKMRKPPNTGSGIK